MTTRNWVRAAVACLAVAAVSASGCRSTESRQAMRPSLSSSVDGDPVVVEDPSIAPGRTLSYVDRHPLFSKPRDYYENTNSNRLVKAASATFVGIPAGVLGELRQIVVGAPPDVVR